MVEGVAVIAIALGVVAACLVSVRRWRRMRDDARRDARLADALRAEITAGRLPEARDCVRAAEGPLSRVLLGVLRFPYGVHERAIEMARRDGLEAERVLGGRARRVLPILSGVCAAASVAPLVAPAHARPSTPAWLGAAGACAVLLLRAFDARRARHAARRLETQSAEVAPRIVALSDSSSPGEPPLRDGRGPVLADAPVEASLVSSVELQDTE